MRSYWRELLIIKSVVCSRVCVGVSFVIRLGKQTEEDGAQHKWVGVAYSLGIGFRAGIYVDVNPLCLSLEPGDG